MPPPQKNQIYPSFMQMLTDDKPDVKTESRLPFTNVKDLEEDLIKSISQILNSRWRQIHLHEDRIEQHHSLIKYGLPDFSCALYDFAEEKLKLLNYIKHSLEKFEPRLSGVRVEEIRDIEENKRRVEFRVRAELSVTPYHAVSFMSEMEVSTGRFEITQENR